MENSIYTSKYTFDEVVQALDLNYARLQSVLARDYIPLSEGAGPPGRGRPREFDYADIVALEFIAVLQEMGLLLESAVQISSKVLLDAKRLAKELEDAGREHRIFDEYHGEEHLLAFAFKMSGRVFVEQFKRTATFEEVNGRFAKRPDRQGLEPPVSITFFDMSRTIRKIDYELRLIRGQAEAARTGGRRAGRSSSLADHMRRRLRERGIEPLVDVDMPTEEEDGE